MSERHDIELIDQAFAGFRASAAPSVPGIDPAAVHAIVTRRRARTALVTIMAVLAIATPIVVYAVVATGQQGVPPNPAQSNTSTPPPTSTPPTSSAPTGSPDLRNATLTLPDPQLADACGQGGTVTFINGVATVGSATLTIGEMPPVAGDLDGAPGNELVTTLSCSETTWLRLVAVTAPAGGAPRVLGYVPPADTLLVFDPATVNIVSRVVKVATTGEAGHVGLRCSRAQVRGYEYGAGRFTQTSGPTTFPEAPLEVRQVDLRNTALMMDLPGQAVGTAQPMCVSLTKGAGTGLYHPAPGTSLVRYTFTIQPEGFATGSLREFALALVTYRAGNGPTIQAVMAIHRGTDDVQGQILVRTGADGVTAIDDVKPSGDEVTVKLTVNGAQQTWTYGERPSSDLWERT